MKQPIYHFKSDGSGFIAWHSLAQLANIDVGIAWHSLAQLANIDVGIALQLAQLARDYSILEKAD